MRRSGFTLIEGLLTIAIMGVVTGVSIPMYHKYQERSCVQLAAENVAQGVSRARLLSQSSEGDSGWGYSAEHGILFKGASYATRDPNFDESYPVGDCAELSGISEVAFQKLTGDPITAGTIAIANGDASADIEVDDDSGSVSTDDDELVICHYPPGNSTNKNTITVPDNAWPAHQKHGDTIGACPGSSAPSIASSTASSVSSVASSAGGGGSSSTQGTCQDRFSVAANGTITATGPVSATFRVLGSQITYGSNGPEVNVYVSASTNGGSSWTSLYSGADVDGGEQQTLTGLVSGSSVLVRARGYYTSWFRTRFDQTYSTPDATGHLVVLRDGQSPPSYPAFSNQSSLADFLDDILDAQGKIDIGQYDVVIIGELGVSNLNSNSNAVDFQDIVILVSFTMAGSC
ncbi:MAG: lipoprotein [Candidatus Peregrinibacteria bacterium Greene0416_62]|nr:MAG: lipoprotein [Candidatus Peregrinibacteria bacterium Greene0416_62]TSC97552.1 MAG: lipoprotein [Candidatus Peregrinibacteria bacterium Greene1014_49]